MAHVIALTALTALGLSGTSFHETFTRMAGIGPRPQPSVVTGTRRIPAERAAATASHMPVGALEPGVVIGQVPGRRVSEDDDERGVRAWGSGARLPVTYRVTQVSVQAAMTVIGSQLCLMARPQPPDGTVIRLIEPTEHPLRRARADYLDTSITDQNGRFRC